MRHGHAPALQPGFPAYAAHCKRPVGEAGEPDSISAVARRTAERYLVELIDVTEERQAIEQARTERDRALQIMEGRSSFMSQMSHKIRTPLNGIKGIIELARDHSTEPERLLDDLQRADELSGYLLSLINDVLDMSRLNSGHVELEALPFDMRLVARELQSMFEKQAQDAQIGYRVEMDGCDDVFLAGDRMRLNQVIVNFISNALKFTDTGGSVTVTVDALGVFGIPFPDVSFNRSVTIYPPMIDVDVLPDSVTEIFGGGAYGGRSLPGAFEGTGGTWTLDWESATHLQCIDRNAFKNSGIQGSVSISQPDEYVWIGMSAFDGCTSLTSVDVTAGNLYVDQEAFADCPGITEAKLVACNEQDLGKAQYNRIGVNMFAGNSAITDITLGEHVMSLDLYGPGAGYTFTGLEGEEGRIRLHMPDDGQVQRAYLDAWTYRFAGYTDYDSMYAQLETELIDWDTFEWPTEAQVRKEMAARLLEPENRLRAMMGLPAVDASTVVVVDETADKDDPTMPPTSEPDAAANAKSTGEAGRIADSAGINGYDGIWHPADKSGRADAAGADLADDGGDGSSDDAGSDPAARPAAEAAEARPTDTEPSTSAETTPAEH